MASTMKAFGAGSVNLQYDGNGMNRRGLSRTVPMEVLSLSPPRTGTASMLRALEILGYHDVHHMVRCVENPKDNLIWREAVRAKYFGEGKPFERKDFDQVLGHCMATTDWPASAFADDLIRAYPEAKVILVERDFEAWYKSIMQTIGKALHSQVITVVSYLDPSFLGAWMWLCRDMWIGYHGSKTTDKAVLKAKFEEHHAMVKKMVPPEKLLTYRMGDGWEPLCKFLGKPVPNEPFPRINESATFERSINALIKARLDRAVRKTLSVIIPLAGAAAVFHFARTQKLI